MTDEKEVVCETTICDGSKDVVTVIMHDIKTDLAAAAGTYGKYVVYAVAAFVGFQIFKLWRRSRRA
jgi:hypothetical protein